MNTHTARALFDDALYQVLDNKVFWMLMIAVVMLIVPTFMIGIREEGIVFLYGWKVIPYADFFSAFGVPVPEVRDVHLAFIDGLQSLVVDALAGSIGILFCIAATAFFVPRMLEKGAADTLFSKPVSRLALLIARYVAGVLFVSVLACVLVLGMHLGLTVTSGYSDPSFLWSAVTLIYTFSLVHALSTCVAAFTRSSIAAILATLVFFVFNGCVHAIWVNKEHALAVAALASENADSEAAEAAKRDTSQEPIFTFMKATLDVAHYALPKTNDAAVIARSLRRAITGDDFVLWDPAGRLTVMKHPKGFVLASQGVTVDLGSAPAVWVADDAGAGAEIRLSRRSRVIEKPAAKTDSDDAKAKSGAPAKVRRQSASTAARELENSLEDRNPPVQRITRPKAKSDELRLRKAMATEKVSWSETQDGVEILHRTHFFVADDWMYELVATAPASWSRADELDDRLSEFTNGLRLEQNSAAQLRADEWYEKQIGWTAIPKYNAFVSIAASALFAAAMLGLAWFRLMRIDF